MYSDETSSSEYKLPSCSDCKQEFFEDQWTQILLNWINQCVRPETKVEELNEKTLLDIVNRYGDEICSDELDEALLCSDNLEPFIKVKYPILRLRNLCEYSEGARKLYMMTSIMLYHCCVTSKTGLVDADICRHMSSAEQELIVKFCENLGKMEATINNVDAAITGAFESTPNVKYNKTSKRPPLILPVAKKVTEVSSTESSQDSTFLKVSPFKSSVTILPSLATGSSDTIRNYSKEEGSLREDSSNTTNAGDDSVTTVYNVGSTDRGTDPPDDEHIAVGDGNQLPSDCKCVQCMSSSCCPEKPVSKSGFTTKFFVQNCRRRMGIYQETLNWKPWLKIIILLVAIGFLLALITTPFVKKKESKPPEAQRTREEFYPILSTDLLWECKEKLCQRIYYAHPLPKNYYTSLNRCTLLCSGPQLWPAPIGFKHYDSKIVALAKNKLEYKFQSVTSVIVHEYLAEAFKHFLGDLRRLEKMDLKMKNSTSNMDLPVKKLYIQLDVESDGDPRLRVDTEEAYSLRLETQAAYVRVNINAASFCGVRHGLETLSQLILLDQSTGYLITLSNVIIKDAPSYKYRGLMIDTARNYIPVPDLLRTLDAMSTVKMNTFHWRISDVTSFPLLLPDYPQLFELGGYDRNLVYTIDDIRTLVNRAGVRGIRILMEVAAPGPVGRAWSWHPDVACSAINSNYTCDDLCLRLRMTESIFDVLQYIYSTIIELTKVDDVFHLSDGIFSFINCYYLLDTREAYLDKALHRLRLANKGFLPKLPIIWYTNHLTMEYGARSWKKHGVQLNEWQTNPSELFLSEYKVIHSSKWDLSCEMKKNRCHKYRTWQEMYAWKSWRNLEVLTIEGGEAVLWTDLVDTTNLDTHLWPRTAAVAERLWSDIIANNTASNHEYLRLDAHRWRMLLRSIKVQPVWPIWCTFNPRQCLYKIC